MATCVQTRNDRLFGGGKLILLLSEVDGKSTKGDIANVQM